MSKVTEVELRGRVVDSSVEELKTRLALAGVLKEIKKRVLIDYTTLQEGETIEGRTTDIRIRNTNGVSEIIVKTGKWGGSDVRNEHKATVNDSFDSLVRIMNLLGHKKGVLCVRNSEVYQLGEVEISVVEVPGHSHYFEAEIETGEESESEELKDKILATLSSLNLTPFSDEEFYDYIKELNLNANDVFDSNEEPEDFFSKKFGI